MHFLMNLWHCRPRLRVKDRKLLFERRLLYQIGLRDYVDPRATDEKSVVRCGKPAEKSWNSLVPN